ncbi:hypothetical protein DV738_g3165, partial [Chaetothyriales sp. CBS 135597]
MANRLDPRGDFSVPFMDNIARWRRESAPHAWRSIPPPAGHSDAPPAAYPMRKQCYDWIFSSASNVHVAIDRASFKDYFAFKSYVLTVAEQRVVTVKGIGTVELEIKRRRGSKESHTILLENVLYIPNWLCNIVSDVYFAPIHAYDHEWMGFDVSFRHKDGNTWRPWGYTENFCGLHRLVLSRRQRGRSPMLEDRDREVFSINVIWPQSQRDKWDGLAARAARHRSEPYQHRQRLLPEKQEPERSRQDFKDEGSDGLSTAINLTKAMPDISAAPSTPSKVLMTVDANSKVSNRAESAQGDSRKEFGTRTTLLESLPWRKSWAHETAR